MDFQQNQHFGQQQPQASVVKKIKFPRNRLIGNLANALGVDSIIQRHRKSFRRKSASA